MNKTNKKNKIIKVCLGFLLLFALAIPANGAEQPGQTGDVLIIYDEPDLLNLTENILTAFGQIVDRVHVSGYKNDLLPNYKYVVLLTPSPLKDLEEALEKGIEGGAKVLCIGEGFQISGVSTTKNYGAGLEISLNNFYQYLKYIPEFSVITQFEGESFGKLNMSFDRQYPFGIKTGNLYYVPYLSEENISTFALGEMLPDFFNSTYQGGIYVILEDVFAFSDLDMLCKTADELYLANIPFIVKVMPLYSNESFDAFQRYAQALRYVGSKNGAIVMTPPIVNGKATNEELANLTETATKLLTDENIRVLPSIEGFYLVDMEYLKEVKSPAKRYETFSFDVGIVENLPQTDLELTQMVANLNGRWYEFGSYREKFGLKTSMFLETPVDEEIAGRVEDQEAPLFFSIGSNVLTVFVAAILIFILLLIYLARVNYKRKFTKKVG